MGSAALVLLPLLISGFLFNLVFYPFRYFSSRAEGQKLFFMAAGTGFFLGAAVFIFVPPAEAGIGAEINSAVPFPHAFRVLLTLVLAVAVGVSLNAILGLRHASKHKPTAKCVYDKLTEKFGNPLDQLFRRAADAQKLVIVTLKSRKVYCGRIMEVPGNLEASGSYIEMLPSFSGFRDQESLRFGALRTEYPVITLWEAKRYALSTERLLQLTQSQRAQTASPRLLRIMDWYMARLERDLEGARKVIASVGEPPDFDPNDWIKVLPVAEIESASFYDSRAYEVWFRDRDSQAPDTSPTLQPD